MAIRGAEPGPGRVSPHLIVRNGADAVEFYKRAFGAQELYRSVMPGGWGIHAHLRIAGTMVMISDEMPGGGHGEPGCRPASPRSLGGTSVVIELVVDDADAAYQQAVDAGATAALPLMDAFWGDRYGWVTDPYGHTWAIATVREVLTAEQIADRMAAMMRQMQEKNAS